MQNFNKRLFKSSENKVVFGVLGGLGEYFAVDPTILRVTYILITVFSAVFPGVLAYLAIALIVPNQPLFLPPHQSENNHH